MQVPAEENIALLKKTIDAGNSDFTIHELQGLNHLFQQGNTGLPIEYGQIEETFSPKALALISDWINQQTD